MGMRPAAHHLRLIKELEDIEAGRNDRLMVCMPPGSAKSTYVSKLYPAWLLARKPNRSIIACSHTSSLSDSFSRDVQSYIRENEETLGLKLVSEPAELWKTDNNGRYRSAGVGGPITGSRADYCLIDDPTKSRADAESFSQREKVWRWFSSDLMTRLRPGGGVVIVMTRWHLDDLGGRILESLPGRFRTLVIPAFAEEGDQLGRSPGQALWSDDSYGYGNTLNETFEEYKKIGAMRDWSALFQQNPIAGSENAIFKTHMIAIEPVAPALSGAIIARSWDLASTASTGSSRADYTAGVKMARMRDGKILVLDVIRFRGGPDEVERAIKNTAEADGFGTTIGLPQDPGQAGKQQVLHLTRMLMGFRVVSSVENGDKATRCAPYASQVNVGNVSLIAGRWNREYIDELAEFPSGSHDDMADASSRCFTLVAQPVYDTSLLWVGEAAL